MSKRSLSSTTRNTSMSISLIQISPRLMDSRTLSRSLTCSNLPSSSSTSLTRLNSRSWCHFCLPSPKRSQKFSCIWSKIEAAKWITKFVDLKPWLIMPALMMSKKDSQSCQKMRTSLWRIDGTSISRLWIMQTRRECQLTDRKLLICLETRTSSRLNWSMSWTPTLNTKTTPPSRMVFLPTSMRPPGATWKSYSSMLASPEVTLGSTMLAIWSNRTTTTWKVKIRW